MDKKEQPEKKRMTIAEWAATKPEGWSSDTLAWLSSFDNWQPPDATEQNNENDITSSITGRVLNIAGDQPG